MPPQIGVLAGVNGAGKSSIGGATLRAAGGDYYNPDELARELMEKGASPDEANARAWAAGRDLLQQAIDRGTSFSFETTLGGNTITRLLQEGASRGSEVSIWFVGLANADLHVARVRARVGRGGHDIPEALIRQRYEHSRLNLIALLPSLTELQLYDNSAEGDLTAGIVPRPRLVLHLKRGRVVGPADLAATPEWARPIVAAALRSRG
ncbi:MAG TPA: zeta toxin family protein [Thermoanaerobaculia bacterium]|jgi:predicted ABC-type ATPase|nr:zeta toxin family protein [Thermoanaerobaculia bacterium]